jgi:hypothetical protein
MQSRSFIYKSASLKIIVLCQVSSQLSTVNCCGCTADSCAVPSNATPCSAMQYLPMLARPLRNNEQSDQGRWLCFTHHYCTIDTRLILASCHHACTGLGVWPRSQHHEDIVPKTLPLKQHLSNRVIALHEVACKAQCIVHSTKKTGVIQSDRQTNSDSDSDSASEVKWSHWITEVPPHCLSNFQTICHQPSSTCFIWK